MKSRIVGLSVTWMALATFAVGCAPHMKKPTRNRAMDEKTQDFEWAKNVSSKSEKGKVCFQLDVLARTLIEQGDKLMTVRVRDFDFVTVAPPGKNNKFENLYSSEEGDLLAQKANYFFTGQERQPLYFIFPAKNIAQSNAADFFAIRSQEKCSDVVTFSNGLIFKIVSSNARYARLKSAGADDIVYEYFLGGQGQVKLTAIYAEKNIAACGAGKSSTHIVRRQFILEPAEKDTKGRSDVSRPLAQLLNKFVYNFVDEKVLSQDKAPRLYPLNSDILNYMSGQIVGDHVKVDCQEKTNK